MLTVERTPTMDRQPVIFKIHLQEVDAPVPVLVDRMVKDATTPGGRLAQDNGLLHAHIVASAVLAHQRVSSVRWANPLVLIIGHVPELSLKAVPLEHWRTHAIIADSGLHPAPSGPSVRYGCADLPNDGE